MNCHLYGLCSYCSNPYHSSSNCPSWGQFYNFSHEQMNINFSIPGFDSNSNVYNPDWSNHPNFSWQAQAMGNCAPQFHELHHPEYPQFENQVLDPSSYNPLPQQSSLEDTLNEFMEITSQSTIQVLQPKSSLEDALKEFMEKTSQSTIQEIKDVTMANISMIERLEGQFEHLVAKLNKMEEEKLQGQLMAEGHYMIDEDDSNNPHFEHVQATSTLGSEEVFEEIVNEPNLKGHFGESYDQFKFDLDLAPEQDEALLDSIPLI
jgi:uncharacterized coiled-coil protein SlyX